MKQKRIALLMTAMLILILSWSIIQVSADFQEPPGDPGPTPVNPPPDSDGDGWADGLDQCPNEPGTIFGCPDSDGDGIPNNQDACPNEFANTSNGCPQPPAQDTDGDGLPDSQDICPLNGPNHMNGCPDTDHDGVSDLHYLGHAPDNCRFVPNTGQADWNNNGVGNKCDDSDGDGFMDNIDQCRSDPGVAPDGCPQAPIQDTHNTTCRVDIYESVWKVNEGVARAVIDQLVRPPMHLAGMGEKEIQEAIGIGIGIVSDFLQASTGDIVVDVAINYTQTGNNIQIDNVNFANPRKDGFHLVLSINGGRGDTQTPNTGEDYRVYYDFNVEAETSISVSINVLFISGSVSIPLSYSGTIRCETGGIIGS